MTAMAKPTIKAGDWFLRNGNPPSEWVVSEIIQKPDTPPHARLRQKGYLTRTVTLALSVLLEGRDFLPIGEGQ